MYHLLPSRIFGEEDALAAWMLDNAVTYFGTMVENLMLERDEIGSGTNKKYVSRYTLAQLLDPAFLWPQPKNEVDEELQQPIAGLLYDEV